MAAADTLEAGSAIVPAEAGDGCVGSGRRAGVAILDGIVEGSEAVFESKFMLPWSFSEETAADKYMAQLGPLRKF